MSREFYLLELGMRGYYEVWKLQKEISSARAEGRLKDILILVEHTPTFTLGRRGSMENILVDVAGIPIYHVERGGDVTYHGPGQLVGYPIVHLPEAGLEVHGFVRMLEDVIMRSTGLLGIPASRKEGHAGVWVDDRKIASIGIAIQRWVTYHGFALNVNTDMTYFKMINPCGLKSEVLTSMREILGRDVDMEMVKRELLSSFSETFGVKLIPFEIPKGSVKEILGETARSHGPVA